MIDQWSECGSGWAQFSDDMVMRYRLARSLGEPLSRLMVVDGCVLGMARIVWLMLNPSTADAFELDPTIKECRKRSLALGADVMEVVNLFAFRSPYPKDLKKRYVGQRGEGPDNNRAIIEACRGARWVVAAWGNDGALDGRDRLIRQLMADMGINLLHLGLTNGGHPKHPLARGKHRIPATQQPQAWLQ